MGDSKGPDPRFSDSTDEQAGVISLCAHRQKKLRACTIEELVECLEGLHFRAIEVHNHIIEQARLSVLTELCRTTGLVLDLVEQELQAALLTPAALYGRCSQRVFGKKPLQRRIRRALGHPEQLQLFAELSQSHPGVWSYLPDEEEDHGGQLTPLAGPHWGRPREVAGVIVRCGEVSRAPGVYAGWSLEYRGEYFLAFGHRLDRSREVAVRNLLGERRDREDPMIWQRIELKLLRAIADPQGCHMVPGELTDPEGIRRPPTRNALILAIHRALWRHFAEPCDGLTIHAHLAALTDDEEGRRDFIDEVEEIIDLITLKMGGLTEDAEEVGVAEVLKPFGIDSRGRLVDVVELRSLPLGLLLLDERVHAATGLPANATIADSLAWASDHPDRPQARTIQWEWMNFRTEQNLMVTYGWRPGAPPEDDTQGGLPFARRSAVLPNIRTLFDARLMMMPLIALPLPSASQARLERALEAEGYDLAEFVLADLGRDERCLTRLHGVSHQTCNDVRRALLDLGTHWRWWQSGIEPGPESRYSGDDEDEKISDASN